MNMLRVRPHAVTETGQIPLSSMNGLMDWGGPCLGGTLAALVANRGKGTPRYGERAPLKRRGGV